jgi:hypothetical protein
MNTGTIISFLLKRKWIVAILFIVTPAGFMFKLYRGPGHIWFNNYGASVLYEIFWCMVIFFFCFRKSAVTKIAAGVFLATSFIEVLQLWHPWFLQQVRSTFLGGALLGSTFVWWDFPHYVLGCLIGWLWMRAISKRIPPT